MKEPPYEPVTLKPAIPEVIHPIQYGSTPQRLLLPRSDIEILMLFNDDISSNRDDNTVWVTADPTTLRARQMTNIGEAAPVFREAIEISCPSFPPEFWFTSRPNRLLEQTRISILSWNPRPRRGTPGAIEKHIAREMAHYRVTEGNRVLSARFPHEPFPHLPLCWLRCLVKHRYLLPRRWSFSPHP